MKHWKTALLMISLAFNFGFLGAFVYRSMERRASVPGQREIHVIRRECADSGRIELQTEVMDLQQGEKKHRTHAVIHPQFVCMRQNLVQEKKKLGTLLLADPIDTAAIQEQLRCISQVQLQLEREVVDVLICQSDTLDPPQRRILIHRLVDRMQADPRSDNSSLSNTPKKRILEQQNPKRRNP